MRLRLKLLLIHGAVILGGMTVTLVVLEKMADRALRRSAERRLRQSAALLAEQGQKRIAVELSTLESWAAMPLVVQTAADDRNPELLAAFAEYFKKETTRGRRYSVYLISRAGDCVASDDSRRLYDPHVPKVVSKRFGALAAFAGECSIGSSIFSTATARPIVPLSVPVRHKGDVIAILRTSVDMTLLQEHLFDSVRIGEEGRVYMDDPELIKSLPQGQTLLVPDMQPQWSPPPDPIRQALEKAPGDVYYYRGLEGRQVLASARMSNPPWMVIVTQPLEEVLAPIQMLRKAVFLPILVLFGLLVGATLVLVAPVVRGIEACRAFAVKIGEGRLRERLALRATDEVGDLACELNAMASGLEKGRSALADAEAKYRTLFENAVEGMFQTDIDGTVLAANPALARIVGFDRPEQMVGVNVGTFYVDVRDRDVLIEELLGNGQLQHSEFDLRRKNGDIRHCSVTANRLHSRQTGGGSIIQGYLEDITERHFAEESAAQLRETERLLSEAELLMLRFQLNPHFLFNALNSVNVLVEDEPEHARQMICLLADFCRATLLVPDDGMATIEDEVELLEQYLAIEKMRWYDTLQVNILLEEELKGRQIPVFTLQPLAENAIKYGQLSGADPLEICVRIVRQGSGMLVEVANTGKWVDPAGRSETSAGIGLINLEKRIRNACGEGIAVETEETNGWVTVRISFP
jgi:PAS domain S-box-containing protein